MLAVCGHANADVQLQVREIPKAGQSTPILERRTVWGGTGANVARHAAGLGVPTRFWARVGEDFPEGWRAAMAADGVDLRLDVVQGAQTPTCFVLTDALERQVFCMDQGPMASMAENPPQPDLLEGMGEGDWLHLATGDPLAYAALADEARLRGIRVALDPGQELRTMYDLRSLTGLLSFADVLFLNEAELQVACGLLERAGADELLDLVPMVVVTRGAKPVSLHRRGKAAFTIPVPPAKVVDPTGAGDAFRAGWYAALLEGHDAEEAVRWGIKAAGTVVGMVGPQERALRRADLTRPR